MYKVLIIVFIFLFKKYINNELIINLKNYKRNE